MQLGQPVVRSSTWWYRYQMRLLRRVALPLGGIFFEMDQHIAIIIIIVASIIVIGFHLACICQYYYYYYYS